MVSGSEIDGENQTLNKTIQSIKEVVRNHSDDDIREALTASNMDVNETVEKLMNQDPFREVKRRKDKKKENTAYKGSSEPRKLREPDTTSKGHLEAGKLREPDTASKGSSEPRKLTEPKTAFKSFSEPRKFTEHTEGMRSHTFPDRQGRRPHTFSDRQGMKPQKFSDRNARRAGVSREFRVVRDNRVNQNTNTEIDPASVQSSASTSVQVIPNVSRKSPVRNATDQKHLGPRNLDGQKSSHAANGPSDLGRGKFKDTNSNSTSRRGVLEDSRAKSPAVSLLQGSKPHNSQQSAPLASSNTVVGLYSSSLDPVHVPSNSRSSGTVGAIRREVGVVGIRRQPSENSAKHSNVPSSSVSTSLSAKDISPISEPFHPSNTIVNNYQLVQTSVAESVVSTTSISKSTVNNYYGGKSHAHQQPTGHQKASLSNKEWKPKSSQKSSYISHVATGTTITPVPPPMDNSTDSNKVADHLQETLSRVGVSENEYVYIPQHLRVPEAVSTRLTFGSFGIELDSTSDISSGLQGEFENQQQFNSTSFGAPSSSTEDVNQVDSLNAQVRNSESASPASTAVSEHTSPDKKQSSSAGNSEQYADIGMVRNNSPSYAPAEPQQRQDPPLTSFAAYDQTGYDMAFYRPSVDDSARSQSLPSPGEVFSSIPGSSVAMVQQQTVPQLYPQLHVSHYPNYMPYRQFMSPVYMPPMGVPGYSNNPAYPHPSNGNSYMLMPGGSSPHMAAAGLKYGTSQYKPIPGGTPTGFGNYSSPTGYAINSQGTVGPATGLDDSTRMKYKDGNLYIPNPQAETSEIWIQTPREIPGMQSTPYYNMPGQPHAAYLPSHTGHASFNGAAAVQPTHMQFPGLYHPNPQQATIANPHHMVPNMGGNVGVGVPGAAPGAQIGAYQQPQLGHMNWNSNF